MLSSLTALFLLAADPALGAPPAAPSVPPVAVQAQEGPSAEDSARRSAEAAEKAAQAAQSAAESAAQTALSVEKLTQALELKLSSPATASTATAEAAPAAGDAVWSGLVGLSLISLTGNSSSITGSATASIRRESERWIFAFKAGGAYGRTRPANAVDETGAVVEVDPEIVALNANIDARADFRFTQVLSVYLLAGASTDHVKSIEAAPYGEAGLSILWVDRKKGDLSTLRLQTDFAFRGGQELRYQYYPEPLDLEDQTIAAPRFGFAFRYAFSDGLIFTEDFEVLPNVIGESRVWVSSQSKIAVKLIKALSFNASFLVTHDTNPAEGKEKTDTALTIGLELGF